MSVIIGKLFGEHPLHLFLIIGSYLAVSPVSRHLHNNQSEEARWKDEEVEIHNAVHSMAIEIKFI